ncbi:MAG TPA: prepilin peptidase [Aliarcobacter thereius]|uniref:Peptidase A24 n=1 Tax=Aliarcobacter thereius TaxID=544718 RepID=A0A5R9H7U3_9BACT|nr:prepilin peptidase [Aliarcobacter thereius]TLS73330.1 peptidase A24 [Aliarcobacter thereius]HJE03596.1 prepilin peptidase [Aliarcobacter thereius]
MENILLALFCINLLFLVVYDFKYKAVPDYLLLISFVLAFFITKQDLIEAFKSAFIISGAFVLLNFLATFYIQNIKSRIFKDENLKTQTALGEGDVVLLASFGIILGLTSTVILVFLAAIFAIFLYIYQVKRDGNREIPFIPPLALAFFITHFFDILTLFKDYI